MNNKEKLELIKKAKELFVRDPEEYGGMCNAFFTAMYGCYTDSEIERFIGDIIRDYIPEFNPEFLGSVIVFRNHNHMNTHYWWEAYENHLRIEAFDKLISVYERNDD